MKQENPQVTPLAGDGCNGYQRFSFCNRFCPLSHSLSVGFSVSLVQMDLRSCHLQLIKLRFLVLAFAFSTSVPQGMRRALKRWMSNRQFEINNLNDIIIILSTVNGKAPEWSPNIKIQRVCEYMVPETIGPLKEMITKQTLNTDNALENYFCV